jgi:ribosomal protein L29
MKTKDKKQLGEKTVAELASELKKVKEDIVTALLDKTSGKLKNTSSLTNKRKMIAIIKTKMREKELLER